MYYHPCMFDWATGERTLAACQAFVGVWLDGLARQQQARAEAVNMFCVRQVEGLRTVAEARDTAQFAARLLACAAPEPHGIAQLSARLAGIVLDTQRKLGELVAVYGDELTRRPIVELCATVERRSKQVANGGRAVVRTLEAA